LLFYWKEITLLQKGNDASWIVILQNENNASIIVILQKGNNVSWIVILQNGNNASLIVILQNGSNASLIIFFTEILGKLRVLYFDPHPTHGFSVTHRQLGFPDSYFILCRQKDPGNIDQAIEQAVEALGLDINDFYVKSKDFGNTCIEFYT
jgi:hypothetical protein